MAPKLYQSEKWLKLQHYDRKKTIEEIAAICRVEPMTIRRQFTKFGIKVVK